MKACLLSQLHFCKYNIADGWIKIQARQTPTILKATIANSSKHIPKSDRACLFDRFYRGDPAYTRKLEDIGLGLSLACEIVRAHCGYLTFDSITSSQTDFTLTLPIAES